MGSVLAELAREVGVSERTLRRAVGSGLIRAQRPSARRLLLPDPEAAWIQSHWPLIGRLLAALRTEPNLQLVALFGSVSRGDEVRDVSDVDLVVELRHPHPGALEALHGRLNEHVKPEVQLVPLRVVQRDPHLFTEVLRDGRPLVDRSGQWPALQAQARQVEAQAEQTGREIQAGAQAAIGYFQRLATARAQAVLVTDR
jgi:predicted nucleotidyltransferase